MTTSAPHEAPVGKKIPYTGLPTENPNATIVPGKMRSDREEFPEGFTKEQADQTETLEARDRMSRQVTSCQKYWPAPHDVCGAIRDKYNSLGAQFSFLLLPTSGEQTSPDGQGKFTTFMNGPIYWSAAGGAHPVVNSILNRWGVHQYEMGWLGYPTTDEIVHADGVGRRQEFQNGAVYVAFTNAIGSAIKNGPIRDKWNTVGGSEPGGSLLGYITGDEIPLPDNQGRMARFENGVIYWHPTYGAWMIRGGILNQWEFIGYEGGTLGYPASDEYVDNGVIKQLFANHLLEFGENEPDPTTPLSRASGDAIDFYTGDSFRLGGVAGILEIRRNAPQDDSRKLAWGFSVSSLAINRAQYGLSTLKDCTSVITSKSKGIHFKDTSPNHKNMLITHMYHISVPNHDDNRRYSLTISCGFHNKTQNLNGNGTLAYGYTMASINRDYYFRIR